LMFHTMAPEVAIEDLKEIYRQNKKGIWKDLRTYERTYKSAIHLPRHSFNILEIIQYLCVFGGIRECNLHPVCTSKIDDWKDSLYG
jgi:hypothetical protein